MLVALLYCLTMGWTPAPGDVASYTIFLDGVVIQEGSPEVVTSICLSDADTHTVTVQAFLADGVTSGPMSDESDEIQMIVQPPFYATELPANIRSDLDQNGVVGYSDFGVFTQSFGVCNDGLGNVVPCS